MAIMRKPHDRGISIKRDSAFNYDRREREFISREEAESILDYTVEKVPLSFVSNGETKGAGEMYGLVRTDCGELVCDHSVGREFTIPMGAKDAFGWIYDNIVTPLGDMAIEDVVTMNNGGTNFFTFRIGDAFRVTGDRSEHHNSILFSDMLGVSRLTLGTVWTRIVCQNTLMRGRKECEFKIAHTTNSSLIANRALQSVLEELEKSREMKEKMEFLAHRECNSETFRKMLDAVYPLTGKEKSRADAVGAVKRGLVAEQFENDASFESKSLWTAVNAFTYFTNNPPKLNARTDAVGNAYDNIGGAKAAFNAKVFDTAMLLAA